VISLRTDLARRVLPDLPLYGNDRERRDFAP
jgi:hypothetical protein